MIQQAEQAAEPSEPDASSIDDSVLDQTTYATQSVVAGAIGLLLAPIVVGFVAAAIGLHAGVTHLRFRRGARLRVGLGLGLSGLATLLAAGSAIGWGGALLSILLQKSAIEQARQWAGRTPAAWQVVDVDGATHDGTTLRGRLVFIDVASPRSPFSPSASRTLAAFAAVHPEVTAFSWCPDCTAEEARAYRDAHTAAFAMVAGVQGMGEPFTLIPATPSLIVLDEAGVIRLITPGTYTDAELTAVMTAPTPRSRDVLGRPVGESPEPTGDATREPAAPRSSN